MGRLQRLIAVLLAFSKTEPEKPSDNECSWISGTVVLEAVREGSGSGLKDRSPGEKRNGEGGESVT